MTPTRRAKRAGKTMPRLLAAAALLCLSVPGIAPVAGAAGTTRLAVTARIATFFRMQIEYQAQVLTVTTRDIERGYVEVQAASSFSVVTNTQDGFIIDFLPRSDVYRSVLVTGLQTPIEIGAAGGAAAYNIPHGRTSTHQLDYRFMLRPDLQPGSYVWPLQISVRSA